MCDENMKFESDSSIDLSEHNKSLALYICSATGTCDDVTDVVVANSEEEAESIYEKKLNDENIWYGGFISVFKIEFDDYSIIVSKNK